MKESFKAILELCVKGMVINSNDKTQKVKVKVKIQKLRIMIFCI